MSAREKVAEAIWTAYDPELPWSRVKYRRDEFLAMADAAIAAHLEALGENLTRVDIIGESVYEIWADEYAINIQDDGRTMKLFQFGDGCAAKAERDKAFATDVSTRLRGMR